MTPIVRTVTGDVDPDTLGFILPHEHLVNFPPASRTDPDYHLNSVENAIEEVKLFQRAGGTALVEMTGWGYGRDAKAVKRIAEATGMPIIVATGLIMESFFPQGVAAYSEDRMAEIFIREIAEGIDDTGIRAGIIKCGTSQGKMTPAEENAIRAAARAHRATGAAISTHTMAGTMALAQVEVLRSEKVDPARIVIGHLDRNSLSYGYFRLLAKQGVYLGIDNIGKTKYYPDSLRIDIIRHLVTEGFASQILLADDNGRRSYFASYGGGPGLDYIPKVFVSLLREAGISDEDVYQMTVINSRTVLAFDAA